MMAQEFRYPLTRICLRSGTLTLPMALLEVFTEDGDVSVQDTVRGTEMVVRVDGREVSGLESYLEAHALEVNDTIVVKVLDDGGIGFTAEKRVRKPDYRRPDVIGRLLDEVIDAGVPMTEGEIRALHPDLPSGFPLREALEGEPRLTLHEGRWRSTLALEEEQRAAERLAEQRRAEAERLAEQRRAEAERRAEAAVKAAEEREAARRESERRAAEEREAERRQEAARAAQREAAEREAAERTATEREATEREATEREASDRDAGRRLDARRSEHGAGAGTPDAVPTDPSSPEAVSDRSDEERRAVERASRERLAERAEEDVRANARREREARADARAAERGAAGDADDEAERFDWDEPVARGFRFPWQRGKSKGAKADAARGAGARTERDKGRERDADKDPFRLDRLGEARPSATRPSVVPAPRPGLFPGDTALNSASLPPGDPKKSKRAREAFASLGYRVEGLAHGQLMLHADLGRRHYRVLLHVLPDGERLDWAALLARRRDSGAVYLAVLGDHRDLHRLTAPADLARATLWSWAGLERVVELSKTVMLGPVDLEPHFERDGVFEYGLERFERTIAKRVQERGVVSAVLTRLAGLRAPAVFLVDDLVGEPDVPRDQIVRVLERLAEAPFHLISKVDSGEFCLRYRVHDALEQVADYATSLRARLPERQRERVRGLDDADAAAFDPIGADEVDLANAPEQHAPSPAASSPAASSPAVRQPNPSPERLAEATASGGLRVVHEERGGPPSGAADASGVVPGESGASGARRSEAGMREAGTRVSGYDAAASRASSQASESSDPSEQTTRARSGQDALFGEGFGGGGFGEDPVDDVDVAEVIKPKQRGRKRG